jgi:uncharacterized membrane-anchored protein
LRPLPQPRHCERPQVAWQPRKSDADFIKNWIATARSAPRKDGWGQMRATGLPRGFVNLAKELLAVDADFPTPSLRATTGRVAAQKKNAGFIKNWIATACSTPRKDGWREMCAATARFAPHKDEWREMRATGLPRRLRRLARTGGETDLGLRDISYDRARRAKPAHAPSPPRAKFTAHNPVFHKRRKRGCVYATHPHKISA